jgi:3-isopropylmalate/(R)-2-methylmalate dehydratase large subunit
VWRPDSTIAVVDHVNPTTPVRNERTMMIADADRALQVKLLRDNCDWHRIALYDMLDEHQGIEHIVASEQGLVLPGMVMAAGDSHTTSHGAMGALGFGIGSSEIEHLLATQTLVYTVQKSMRVDVWGKLGFGVTAKDLVLELIRRIGADGATGHVIEYTGAAIRALGVEGRLTLCNMSVEAAARGAIVAPDDALFEYLHGRPRVPQGVLWEQAVAAWRLLRTEDGAEFDTTVTLDAAQVQPMVTWGTSPDQGATIAQAVPDPANETDPVKKRGALRALDYMGLQPGQPLEGLPISHAFIGSCTNSRIDDLRDAARVLRGRRVAQGVRALVVPGSSQVRAQAEAEGLAPFDVRGDERRPPAGRRPLRLQHQPQFRRAPGRRGAHAPHEPGDGGGRRRHRRTGRRAQAAAGRALRWKPSIRSPASPRACPWRTWTPTRSCPSSSCAAWTAKAGWRSVSCTTCASTPPACSARTSC